MVETTSFTDKTTSFARDGRSAALDRRFRLVDADTLLYEFIIDDPASITRPMCRAPWGALFSDAILEQAPRQEASALLDESVGWAARSCLRPFIRVARTIRMLRLMETHPATAVEYAVTAVREVPHLETVRPILRQQEAGPPPGARCVCRRSRRSGSCWPSRPSVSVRRRPTTSRRLVHLEVTHPGAPHPAAHPGCLLPDAEDAGST